MWRVKLSHLQRPGVPTNQNRSFLSTSRFAPPCLVRSRSLPTQSFSSRNASHYATSSPASSNSQWPLTAALSLSAFAVGFSINNGYGNATQATKLKAKHGSENASTDDNFSIEDKKRNERDATNAEIEGSSANDDEKERAQTAENQSAKDGEQDEDRIVKPELEENDAKGWREFAGDVREKYNKKLDALKELSEKLKEVTEARDDYFNRLYWAHRDAQRNLEFLIDSAVHPEMFKSMVLDDALVDACPLDPPEGLFETPIKPVIIRVLDSRDLTSSLIINIEGKAPSGDEESQNKQWAFVYEWVSDLTKMLQQSDQISSGSFWTILFSKGWYKCGFPAYKTPDRAEDYPTAEVKSIAERVNPTSAKGMERYHVMTDKRSLKPFSYRLGRCATTATVYPSDKNDEGDTRPVQVLVDTGAEVTFIAERDVPKDANVIETFPITVVGFGGGSETLNQRVKLRLKLHGDDKDKGIDIITTAYVMKETASGLGVELGTDVMKPLAPSIDLKKSIIHLEDENGKTREAPLVYLKEDEMIKDPTPQTEDAPARDTPPPTSQHTMGQVTPPGDQIEDRCEQST